MTKSSYWILALTFAESFFLLKFKDISKQTGIAYGVCFILDTAGTLRPLAAVNRGCCRRSQNTCPYASPSASVGFGTKLEPFCSKTGGDRPLCLVPGPARVSGTKPVAGRVRAGGSKMVPWFMESEQGPGKGSL